MTIQRDERAWDDDVHDPVPTSWGQFAEFGVTGLKRAAGTVDEEFLPALRGRKAISVFREMSLNDPIVGALLFAIDKLVREVTWHVTPPEHAEGEEAARFVEECMEDMSHSWDDFISEVLSCLVYGWSWHEIVYKKRVGPWEKDGKHRSKHSDGRIGWRKMPIRAQETMLRWIFDDSGGIQGMVQQAPPRYQLTTLPIEKSLLFRTAPSKGNPEGRSLLRNAYRPWYFKKRLEEFEGIGVERDLAGMPVAKVPADYFNAAAGSDKHRVLQGFRKMVRGVRRDENEGLVLPNQYDADTKQPLFEFELMSSSGARQFDTNAIIQRYEQRILMTVLADFILVGHQSTGSYSLHTDKSGIFRASLNSITKIIADTLNRHAIPRLFEANGWKLEELPKIEPSEIDPPDLDQLASFISATAGAGMQWFPDPELEKFIRDIARLPEIPEEILDIKKQQHEQITAMEFAQGQMDMLGLKQRAEFLNEGYTPEQTEIAMQTAPPEFAMREAEGQAYAQRYMAEINPEGDPMAAAEADRQMQMQAFQGEQQVGQAQALDSVEEQKFRRQLELLRAQAEHGDGELGREEKRTKLQLQAEKEKSKLGQSQAKFDLQMERRRFSTEKEKGKFSDKLEDSKHRRAKDLFGTKGKYEGDRHKRELERSKLQQTTTSKRPDPKNPKDAGKKGKK